MVEITYFFVVLQLETSLKLAQVEMYQSKLKERDRRKRVSRELGLVENFFKENTYNALTGKFVLQKPKKKDPKTEVLDRLKFVSSFLGAEEHRRMDHSLCSQTAARCSSYGRAERLLSNKCSGCSP